MTPRRGSPAILLLALAVLAACNGQSPAAPGVSPGATETASGTAITPVETRPVAVAPPASPLSTESAGAPAPTVPTVTAAPVTAFDPGTGDIDGTAEQDAVFAVRQDAQERQQVPWLQTFFLGPGDGVEVDQQGWATLRYKDLWTVKVERGAGLTITNVTGDPSNLAAQARLRSGALFNNFDPAKVANLELSVDGDLAKVVIRNATVAIVEEATTPLQWAIVLSSSLPAGTASPVEVTANDVTTPAFAGTAIWAAPVGPPSQPIAVDPAQVEQWFANLENGIPQPEIGEILLPPADLEANVCAQPSQLEPDVPFDMEGVAVTLAPESAFGPASYWTEDCNQDGLPDLAMRNGSLQLDFRGLPARVRALDVPLVNRAEGDAGFLAVLDPAVQEVERQAPAPQVGQEQLLSLRSAPGSPYHYAELALKDGCFLGVSLTPPAADGSPGTPRRPAAETFPMPGAQCQLAVGIGKTPRTHLRTGPGTDYPATPVLVQRADTLAPLAQNPAGTWLQVQAPNGQKGWISQNFLSCVEIRCLPIVKSPPPPRPTSTREPAPRPSPAPDTPTPEEDTPPPTEPPPTEVPPETPEPIEIG